MRDGDGRMMRARMGGVRREVQKGRSMLEAALGLCFEKDARRRAGSRDGGRWRSPSVRCVASSPHLSLELPPGSQ